MEIVEEHRRVAHMLRELGHVSTEGILVGREPSGSKIYKVVRHYRSAEAPFCWSSVRPVGKVEQVVHPKGVAGALRDGPMDEGGQVTLCADYPQNDPRSLFGVLRRPLEVKSDFFGGGSNDLVDAVSCNLTLDDAIRQPCANSCCQPCCQSRCQSR